MKKDPKSFENRKPHKWYQWFTVHFPTYLLIVAYFAPVPAWVFTAAVAIAMTLTIVYTLCGILLHFLVNKGLLIAEPIANPYTKAWMLYDYITDVFITYIFAAAGIPVLAVAYVAATAHKLTEPTYKFTPVVIKKVVEGEPE
jgi:hypothetical protein